MQPPIYGSSPILLLYFLAYLPWTAQGSVLQDDRRHLYARADSGSLPVADSGDFDYTVDITLGGQTFTVQIDTGSADLWVATTDTSGFTSTGATADVTYAVTSISGPILTGDLQLAGFTVPNQPFIAVTPSSDTPSGTGLIGLGPFKGSRIAAALNFDPTTGAPPLDRIFAQNTTTPNYITVQLGRDADPHVSSTGTFTIGQPMSTYQNITSQAKLNVTALQSSEAGNQHWQVLMDSNGMKVNGQTVETPSAVSINLGSDVTTQLAVVLDTGYTFPQVPKSLSDAIYANISGAVFRNVSGVGEIWVLPCDAEIDLAFEFGGQTIPIHPLDSNIQDGNDCLGSFQPVVESAESTTFDAIFGMAFLRNVYLLIDFGDFIDESNTTHLGPPYVQMIATTNVDDAKAQFQSSRSGSSNSLQGWREIVVIVLAAVGGLLLISSLVLGFRRRLMRRRSPSARWSNTMRQSAAYQAVQLQNPEWSSPNSYPMRAGGAR